MRLFRIGARRAPRVSVAPGCTGRVRRRFDAARAPVARAIAAAVTLGALVPVVTGAAPTAAVGGTRPAAHTRCAVPLGAGHMGVCVPRAARMRLRAASGGGRYYGADVSNWQGCVDPSPKVVSFIFIKIDEGLDFHDPYGACTEAHARQNGVDSGLYFFERDQYPARASADKFVTDSRAIGALGSEPGALDFETNDAGLSAEGECDWIRAFGDEYRRRSGLSLDVVYSAPTLWPGCTHVPSAAAWVATYGPSPGILSGFPYMRIWQYTDQGPYGGDGDVFIHGTPRALLVAAHHATLTLKATIDNARLMATFKFKAVGKVSSFQCAITVAGQTAPHFHACRSPARYAHLKPGSYVFSVRSLGPRGGPKGSASRSFTIGSA